MQPLLYSELSQNQTGSASPQLCLPLPARCVDTLRGSVDRGTPIPDSQRYNGSSWVHRRPGTTVDSHSGLGLAFSQWQASIAEGIPAEYGEVHFWFLLTFEWGRPGGRTLRCDMILSFEL